MAGGAPCGERPHRRRPHRGRAEDPPGRDDRGRAHRDRGRRARSEVALRRRTGDVRRREPNGTPACGSARGAGGARRRPLRRDRLLHDPGGALEPRDAGGGRREEPGRGPVPPRERRAQPGGVPGRGRGGRQPGRIPRDGGGRPSLPRRPTERGSVGPARGLAPSAVGGVPARPHGRGRPVGEGRRVARGRARAPGGGRPSPRTRVGARSETVRAGAHARRRRRARRAARRATPLGRPGGRRAAAPWSRGTPPRTARGRPAGSRRRSG